MKFLALPKTIGLAGIVAGSALLAGGGGLGVAALASAQPAGALTGQLPAVGVREQNVNSAGRIRVALPSGGVGVNGNVSVNNFPKTQAVNGTVNVGNLPVKNGQVQVSSSGGAAAPATPTSYGSVVSCGNGSYQLLQMLPPAPAGETYHLGLVTIVANAPLEYDLVASNGSDVSSVNAQNNIPVVLPFGGLALGAGQGLYLGTNTNGCQARVTFDYWVGSAG
ncbi:MAG: hypothetical protein ACYCV7_14010 [Acidimicrobiales bacterium]